MKFYQRTYARKVIAPFVLCAFFMSSCSTFRPSTQVLTITTSQPDAEIYVNGSLAGKGRVQVVVERNRSVQILAKKDGFVPVSRTVGREINTTGILDTFGGMLILLPLIGLLSPGAYSLQADRVDFVMIKA